MYVNDVSTWANNGVGTKKDWVALVFEYIYSTIEKKVFLYELRKGIVMFVQRRRRTKTNPRSNINPLSFHALTKGTRVIIWV